MKAITRTAYGGPEVLTIKDIEKPTPKANEVLIRVHATTVNRTDCGILWGKPSIIRAFTGLTKPSSLVPGTDFAGQVEAIGSAVSTLKPGDRVWGLRDEGLKSHAEYMTFAENGAIAKIPDNITFAQAAASAEGAHYAYNFITKVKLQAGQKVLVNGATGAIGSAAVQLLKYFGLHVTAVCATPHIEKVKALGADEVIDYLKEDFTKREELFDFVFDAVGKSSFGICKPILKPGGIYISSELGPGNENLYLPFLTAFQNKKLIFPIPVNCRRSVLFLSKLMAEGKFMPLIDRTYLPEQIAEAYTYTASGQKIGNVVLDFRPLSSGLSQN